MGVLWIFGVVIVFADPLCGVRGFYGRGKGKENNQY
jgi:hypothetical protein